MNYKKLVTELICLSNGAELKSYSENLAINGDGELIEEVKITILANTEVNEIEVTLGFEDE